MLERADHVGGEEFREAAGFRLRAAQPDCEGMLYFVWS
jgi:hypothetical protein